MRNILYLLLGIMAGLAFSGVLVFVSRTPTGEAIILQPAPTKAPLAVHIVGAVPRPGLYEFAEGARVQDAINAAGGLLVDADVDSLNLAALLEDGKQLIIQYQDGGDVTSNDDTVDLPSTDDASPDEELVNINTASLEELNALPGIGPTTAQKIIDYRTENGEYSTIEDIMNVSGIGPATFEEIKDLITT